MGILVNPIEPKKWKKKKEKNQKISPMKYLLCINFVYIKVFKGIKAGMALFKVLVVCLFHLKHLKICLF